MAHCLMLKKTTTEEQIKKLGYDDCLKPWFNDYFKKIDDNHFLCINLTECGNIKKQVSEYKGCFEPSGITMMMNLPFESAQINKKHIKDLIDNDLVEEVK